MTFIQSFIWLAGLAGCAAKTVVAPLDRVKILLQAHNQHYKHLGGSFEYIFLCLIVSLETHEWDGVSYSVMHKTTLFLKKALKKNYKTYKTNFKQIPSVHPENLQKE